METLYEPSKWFSGDINTIAALKKKKNKNEPVHRQKHCLKRYKQLCSHELSFTVQRQFC